MKKRNRILVSVTLVLYVLQYTALNQSPTAYADTSMPGEQSPVMEGSSVAESNERNEAAQNQVYRLNEGLERKLSHYIPSPDKEFGLPHRNVVIGSNISLNPADPENKSFTITLSDLEKEGVWAKVYDVKTGKTYIGLLDRETNQIIINEDGLSIFIQLEKDPHDNQRERKADAIYSFFIVKVLRINDGKTTEHYAFDQLGRVMLHKSIKAGERKWSTRTEWTYKGNSHEVAVRSLFSLLTGGQESIYRTAYLDGGRTIDTYVLKSYYTGQVIHQSASLSDYNSQMFTQLLISNDLRLEYKPYGYLTETAFRILEAAYAYAKNEADFSDPENPVRTFSIRDSQTNELKPRQILNATSSTLIIGDLDELSNENNDIYVYNSQSVLVEGIGEINNARFDVFVAEHDHLLSIYGSPFLRIQTKSSEWLFVDWSSPDGAHTFEYEGRVYGVKIVDGVVRIAPLSVGTGLDIGPVR